MKKRVIRLTETDIKNIVRRVISEQNAPVKNAVKGYDDLKSAVGGPDPEIVETLKDMGFEKQFCKNAKVNPMGIELSYEYCNKARPQILVSYPKPYDSAEVVDLINQKIIEIIDNVSPEKLESAMKGYFANQ
jgi:hypothetical protein